MAVATPKRDLTYTEYAKLEETSEVKHHYIDGELYAMSGGTPEHSRLAADIIVLLAIQLRGKPCRAYAPDLRRGLRHRHGDDVRVEQVAQAHSLTLRPALLSRSSSAKRSSRPSPFAGCFSKKLA